MSHRFAQFLLFCLCLLGSPASRAEETGPAKSDNAYNVFSLKGFGTLGLARSDSDSAEYVRDLSQPRGLTRKWSAKVDSLLGVQGNLKLDAQTDAVVQVISRYRFDGSYHPEVSWAFLRHDFSPDFQLRLGRLGTEFYMLGDSRLVGYSYQTLRPPPDFYGSLIFSYFDGFDTTVSRALGDGLLRAKFFAGLSPETAPFSEPYTWSLKGSPMAGGHLDYFVGDWQFRASHANFRFANEQPTNAYIGFDILGAAPELAVKNTTASFDSLGAVYDSGQLQVQAMVSRTRHQASFYEDSRAAFVVASYRLRQLTPFIGYSQVKSSTNSFAPTGDPQIDMTIAGLAAKMHIDQHTTSVGARWDFHPDLALKLQVDTISGQPQSLFHFPGPDPHWNGRMKVFSVGLDFVF